MTQLSRALVVISFCLESALLVRPAGAQKTYWIVGPTNIVRVNLDGTQFEVVHEGLQGMEGLIEMAIDAGRGKIYWTDAGSNKIKRANLHGSNVEDLVTEGLNQPWGIALDVNSQHIYWTNRLVGKIQRSNLDGTQVVDVLSDFNPYGIALDLPGGKIYWSAGSRILRADLHGANIEEVIQDPLVPVYSVDLDLVNGWVYWAGNNIAWCDVGVIRRARLDGSDMQTLIDVDPDGSCPKWIELAVERGEIYWTDAYTGIRRANLDGTAEEHVFVGIQARGLALYLTPCCRPYGDVYPPDRFEGACILDVDDLLLVLNEFVNPANATGADLFPCGGDGVVDVDDIVAELEAFIGYAACETQCP